jgi:hypothetical protein
MLPTLLFEAEVIWYSSVTLSLLDQEKQGGEVYQQLLLVASRHTECVQEPLYERKTKSTLRKVTHSPEQPVPASRR